MRADFLLGGGVNVLRDADGHPLRADDGSEILQSQGGCFDTDEAAARLGWNDEEKAYAEAFLLAASKRPQNSLTLWEPPAPQEPLPNWGTLSPTRALALAAELGRLPEALAYERASGERPELVELLEKKLGTVREQEKLDEALTAA